MQFQVVREVKEEQGGKKWQIQFKNHSVLVSGFFLILEMENRPRMVLSRNNYTWKETAWVSFASSKTNKTKAGVKFVYISRTNPGFHCMPTERGGRKSIAVLSGLALGRGTTAAKKVEQAGTLKAERGEAKVVRTHVFPPLILRSAPQRRRRPRRRRPRWNFDWPWLCRRSPSAAALGRRGETA